MKVCSKLEHSYEKCGRNSYTRFLEYARFSVAGNRPRLIRRNVVNFMALSSLTANANLTAKANLSVQVGSIVKISSAV